MYEKQLLMRIICNNDVKSFTAELKILFAFLIQFTF